MGGSGGGGGAGETSWPQYMEDYHTTMLSTVVNTTVPEMIAANPFIAAAAFDPTTDLGLAWAAVCEFDAFVDALSHESDWESAATTATTFIDNSIVSDDYLDADIAAFAAVLDDDLNSNVFPQFKSGMRDVNAVMSSAFVLGEADIYAKRTREVAKYGTDLRSKLHLQRNDMIIKSIGTITNNLISTAELEGKVATISVDAKRIAIVAQKEQTDMDLEIDENDARWDNEAWVYGANMLAAISGGTRGQGGTKPTAAQSALSGGLSGAAIGAQVGGPMGALAGGIIGIGAGLLFN